MAGIGIAISGGGHRAALYGLGVLLYLGDVEKNRDVVSISSVSGGSLTNAFVGLRGDFSKQTPADFRDVAGAMASQLANRGSFFAWVGTKLYIAALVVAGIGVAAVWWLPYAWPLRLLLFVVALIVWDIVLLRRRGDICGRAYAATLFGGGTPPALTRIAHNDIDHVLCATHLNAGEHAYFSGSFVYSYRFGWGQPGDLPLHVAAQASTALPGAFPPRILPTARFNFADPPPDEAAPPARIALVDGGVYDNMADQWLSGLSDRAMDGRQVQTPDEIVIANASASMGMSSMSRVRWPVLGELFGLARDVSIMYDNSASIRKSDLIDRFDSIAKAPAGGGLGPAGALLDIRSDPFAAASHFADEADEWPERAQRATAALAKKPADWASDAKWAAGLKTELKRFGVERAARLMRHAYALAAMNLHVFLGYRLVDIPPLSEFEELCRD